MPTYPAQWLKRFCDRYGVPYVEIKGWQHTYATLGIEQNHLTPKQVQAQLGHATTNMTLNVYAGITDQEKARTADIMGSIINLDAEFWLQNRLDLITEFTRPNETGWILVQLWQRKKGFTTRI